jgi:cysteine desulfurase
MAIYLDHAATSPMPAGVLAAYTSALGLVGNPASIHSQGQTARRMLEEAREQVAASLGADSVEVTFTSGGTESINLAIKGLFWARNAGGPTARPRPRVLIAAGEHHATVDAADWLAAAEGAEIDMIPIDALGRLDLAALESALARNSGQDVALLSFLLANNEVGTVQPIREVSALAARYGVPVHVDAVAAYGYLPIDFHDAGVAALSVSAHKIGGPVGIGALLIARSATVVPLIHGGNQQRGRSGTQDAAGAVAFGVAATAAATVLAAGAMRLRALRDRLIAGVRAAVPDAILRGDLLDRLPGNVHFTFPGCEGDSLLFLLDVAGFSVSTGSACQAGVPEASHVLLAMGVSEADARGALRFTLGHTTTEAEIDALIAALPDVVRAAGRAGLADRVVVGAAGVAATADDARDAADAADAGVAAVGRVAAEAAVTRAR